MNTIPTIFNEKKYPYAILGNSASDSSGSVSVIILNRGARYYLSSLFKNLHSIGLNNIIYVDKTHRSFEIKALSNEFPEVKFVLPYGQITTGEMINIGMSETFSNSVFVLWTDMSLADNFFNDSLILKLEDEKSLCIAPSLVDQKNNKIPVQIVPSITNMDFSTEQFLTKRDFTKTLYPFDFSGIYSRERFIKIGGFDYTIENPYWQILDFGFRANLWSYNFFISHSLKIKYSSEVPVEDISADSSYVRFYLKNLALIVKDKGVYLPKKLFLYYLKKSGLNPIKAYKYFSLVRDWVNINRYRFKKSPHKLISEWEPVL